MILREKCWAKGIHFSTMPRNKYASLLANTKIVIDMPSPSQVGSTMRTIESLSMNKKLFTTNKNIVNESFYNAANIVVLQNNVVDEYLIGETLNSSFDDSKNDSLNTIYTWLSKMGF